MVKEKKFFKGMNDGVFKAIFTDEKNQDLLIQLIKETINKEVKIIKIKLPEQKKSKAFLRAKTLDVVCETKHEIINIEVNSGISTEIRKRNAAFIFKQYSDDVLIGDEYEKMHYHYQINLSVLSNSKPIVSTYKLINEYNEQFIDNLKIYEFNLPKLKDLWYNDGNKTYKILPLLDADLNELGKVTGDETMEKLKGEIERLNNDDDFIHFLSEEQEHNIAVRYYKNEGYNKDLKDGVEQGKIEGIQEGSKAKELEIAKSMLNNNIDVDTIVKCTNLSIEEIKNLKQ